MEGLDISNVFNGLHGVVRDEAPLNQLNALFIDRLKLGWARGQVTRVQSDSLQTVLVKEGLDRAPYALLG